MTDMNMGEGICGSRALSSCLLAQGLLGAAPFTEAEEEQGVTVTNARNPVTLLRSVGTPFLRRKAQDLRVTETMLVNCSI